MLRAYRELILSFAELQYRLNRKVDTEEAKVKFRDWNALYERTVPHSLREEVDKTVERGFEKDRSALKELEIILSKFPNPGN